MRVMQGDLQRAVGRNLQRIRKERDYSQEKFAEVIGFHRTYVGGLERGERNLSLQAVEGLADRLNVSARSLLDEAEG